MPKIVNGQVLADKINDKIVEDIIKLKGQRPNLAIILVGERKDSCLYVDLKEKEAKRVGIDTHIYKCPAATDEAAVLKMITCLNKDDLIDAILIQLPLPEGFNTNKIISAIDPVKDVDRFHPRNLEILRKTCSHEHVMPPIFKAILIMLESAGCDLTDKLTCIVANSEIFGSSLKRVLECRGALCTVCQADDLKLRDNTSQADILITAIGKKHFITADMVREDAIVIDIGITKEGKKVYGDVDFTEVKEKAKYITPVPGGVGPLTIAMLFKNTLELYKQRHNN